MSGARLILVCGLPGSGKTTLAKQLEGDGPVVREDLERWAEQFEPPDATELALFDP